MLQCQNRVVLDYYFHLIGCFVFAFIKCTNHKNKVYIDSEDLFGKGRRLKATWQSTLSMCRAVVSAFDLLKSSLSTSRTLGSRGRLFSGKRSDSN